MTPGRRPCCTPARLAGHSELRCGSGRWAARSVDVRVDGSIGIGVDTSIGMHAAGGATAHQRAVHLSGACSESGSVEAGVAVCLAQTASSTSRAVQSVPPISLICQRTRASDRLSAKLLCGTVGGRQAAHRRVIDAPSSSRPPHLTSRGSISSSDLIGGKAARRRRHPPGEVADRQTSEAPRRRRSRRKVRRISRLPPYLTLPYLPRVPMKLHLVCTAHVPYFAISKCETTASKRGLVQAA